MLEKADILVVDDEPMNVELLKAILEPKNYHVLTATDGTEALEVLSKEKVDLVLLDVRMPKLDGYEVTRRIRLDEKIKGLPIILVTALHETSERIKGIEAGCDEFVTKPIDKGEVLARISTLLRLNYYRTQVDEKEKFEHVINRMNEGLIICDGDLRVIRSNKQACDQLALLNSDDLSSGWVDRLKKAFKIDYNGNLKKDLSLKDVDFDMEELESSTGRPLILSFSTSLIKDTDGKTASIVIVLNDVTSRGMNSAGKRHSPGR